MRKLQGLLHLSLPHGVNEIGKGWSESRCTHIRGNLAAMIGRMHDHVQQDILLLAAEAFTFRVLVSQRAGKACLAERRQVVLLKTREFVDFQLALLERRQRPNR